MTVTLAQLALFAAAFVMVVASPGPMAAAIVARSMAFGFRSGAAMAVGSIVGDVLFVALAIYGLSLLTVWFESAVVALRYAGAAWLIWMGVRLILSQRGVGAAAGPAPRAESLRRAFMAAVVIGIGNPKAALFYAAIFPGFFDMARLTPADIAAILGVILPILVGGNLIWAAAGGRAGRLLSSARAVRNVNRVSGGMLAGAGLAIATR